MCAASFVMGAGVVTLAPGSMSFSARWAFYDALWHNGKSYGYDQGKKDYMGTGWSVNRAHVSCNPQGGLTFSGFDMENMYVGFDLRERTMDNLIDLFKCSDNWDRSK